MDTAKLFTNGSSQAVRLPKEYRFEDEEVYIRKYGKVVYLIPKDELQGIFLESVQGFTDDFMAEGRQQPDWQDRDRP